MPKLTIEVVGMTCGHCVAAVKRALSAVPGVTVEEVMVGSATVSFDRSTTDDAAISSAIERAGYQVRATHVVAEV